MTEPSEQVAVNRLPFSVRKPGTPAGCGIAVMEEAGMLGSTEPAVSSLPDHLVEADGVHWAFWRTACLRGAGFPSHLIRNLTAPACAHAADEVLATERETEQRRTEAAAAYRKELTQTGNEEQRKTLTSALKRLSKGKLPDAAPESVSELSRQRLAAAMVRAADAKKRFQEEFQAGTLHTSEEIRKVASDRMFRQAVLLQNGRTVSRVIRSLIRESLGPPQRGFKERQNEELIANYLQRYCLKNDTIGFFGPVGWFQFDPCIQGMSVRPGPALVSRSGLYFENWCIEALAEKIALNETLLPWFAPRLSPYFWIDGDTLRSPGGRCPALSPAQAAILTECSGEKAAREIAFAILATPSLGIASEDQVYEVLKQFLSRKIISWTLETPLDSHAERWLRRLLQSIGNESWRCEAIAALDELEHARENVGRCLGDPDRLEQAMESLDSTFTKITGRAANRSAGQMYAGRTLIYQDCRRDLDLRIGSDLVASLAAPLSIVLDSARWFSWQIAGLYRDAFREIHADLAAKTGRGDVDLLQFWTVSEGLFLDPKRKLYQRVMPELQRRWTQILGEIPFDQHCIRYRSNEIRARAEEVFAAPRPGWQLARYHSPDVMIAAANAEAIGRGEYVFVLGEVHVTLNTLRYPFNVTQHSNPQELVEAMSRDFASPRVVPVFSRQWPRVTNRTSSALCSPRDYHLEISPQMSNRPRSHVLPISKFVVENCGDSLIVRTLDGRLRFDVLEFFGEILSNITAHGMEFISSGGHIPRLVLDRLVICRESWSFRAAELKFIDEQTENERFLEVRRWARTHGLPRFAFARVPVEVKPFYVDFDSLIYVEILTKKIRKTLASDRAQEPITLTEMLPAPHELWLPDHQGYKYTSELRFVAKDLKGAEAE